MALASVHPADRMAFIHFNVDKSTQNLSRDSWKSDEVRHRFCRAVFLFLYKADFWVLQSLVNIFISSTDFVKNQISLDTEMISLLPRAKYQPWTLIHGYLIWDFQHGYFQHVNRENFHGFRMHTDFSRAICAPARGQRRHFWWHTNTYKVAPESKIDSRHKKGRRRCPLESWLIILCPWKLCAGCLASPSDRAAKMVGANGLYCWSAAPWIFFFFYLHFWACGMYKILWCYYGTYQMDNMLLTFRSLRSNRAGRERMDVASLECDERYNWAPRKCGGATADWEAGRWDAGEGLIGKWPLTEVRKGQSLSRWT